MTENKKRFTLSQIQLNRPYSINDNKKKECMTQAEVRDMLNALHEENEQLKHDATVLICSNQEYREENEKLKKMYYDILKLLKMELVEE